MRAGVVLAASALCLWLSVSWAAPQSACKVIWTFKLPCTAPVAALVDQVKAWSSKKCSGGQEKCMYELTKESPTYLEIKHSSPKGLRTSDISFQFKPPSAPSFCRAMAISTTQGSNSSGSTSDYCLLYNLLAASGLTEAPGFREIGTEAMCPSKQSCGN